MVRILIPLNRSNIQKRDLVMKCAEKKYEENDAKNRAVQLTNQARRRKPKTGNQYGKSWAYHCDECKAWHIKTVEPNPEINPETCQRLSSIPA